MLFDVKFLERKISGPCASANCTSVCSVSGGKPVCSCKVGKVQADGGCSVKDYANRHNPPTSKGTVCRVIPLYTSVKKCGDLFTCVYRLQSAARQVVLIGVCRVRLQDRVESQWRQKQVLGERLCVSERRGIIGRDMCN